LSIPCEIFLKFIDGGGGGDDDDDDDRQA